jgi:glucoamylase
MDEKIRKLVDASKQAILDCCLPNGAIVAANSTKPHYPKEAKNYFYVWPRDGSFICVACDIAGIKGAQERFFDWLMRAEGWEETGIFYEKYCPNGTKERTRFQPDQTGSVLYALWHHFKGDGKAAGKYKNLVTHSADGLCKVWDKDHFDISTNDCWEERLTFPDLKDNFSYSLAACARGLLCANKMFPNPNYVKTANEMISVLLDSTKKKKYFYRAFGRLNDERADASLLGIIWPNSIVMPDDELAKNTVKFLAEHIVKDFGMYRYEHDEYDGWMKDSTNRKKGAGYWPLLSLWMAIVLNRMGRREVALKYYNKVLSDVDRYIPEQVFNNKIQQGVSPLAWSHAMFLIATKELGLDK